MNNKIKRTGLKTLGTIATVTLGGTHLVLQSLADMTVSAEAHVMNKITGQDKETLKKERRDSTNATQQKVLQIKISKDIMESIKNFKLNNNGVKEVV